VRNGWPCQGGFDLALRNGLWGRWLFTAVGDTHDFTGDPGGRQIITELVQAAVDGTLSPGGVDGEGVQLWGGDERRRCGEQVLQCCLPILSKGSSGTVDMNDAALRAGAFDLNKKGTTRGAWHGRPRVELFQLLAQCPHDRSRCGDVLPVGLGLAHQGAGPGEVP